MTLPILDNDDTPSPAAVCRMLRTKTHYGTYTSTDTPWQDGDSTTAVYWCLATMEQAGPDDAFAHPHDCTAPRPCYQKPLD